MADLTWDSLESGNILPPKQTDGKGLTWDDLKPASKGGPQEFKTVPSDVVGKLQRGARDAEVKALNVSMAKNQLKKRGLDVVEAVAKLGQEAGATADAVNPITLGGMAVGEGTYLLNRIGHMLSGRGQETVAEDRAYADQVTDLFANPGAKIARMIQPNPPKVAPSGTERLLGKLSEKVKQAGESAQEHLSIPKEDVQALFNMAMVGLGGKGMHASVKAGMKPRVGGLKGVEPFPPEPSAFREGQQPPQLRLPAPEERLRLEIDNKTREALEEQQALPQAKGKTRLSEAAELPSSLTGEAPKPAAKTYTPEEILGKSHLDSALDKIGRNAGFDMTAEEKIALRERMQQPNKVVVPKGQSGKVDAKLLANMALVGGGAAAGYWLAGDDDKVNGLILGALGGVVASNTSVKGIRESVKKLATPDNRIRITDVGDAYDYNLQAILIELSGQQQRIVDLVPKRERRAAISRWLENPDSEKLSPKEMEAAKIARDYCDAIGLRGLDEGTLRTLRENYVTHVYDWGKADKGLLAKLIDAPEGQGMSPKSPFAKQRSYATLEEAKRAGLTPKTEDVAELMGYYGQSMGRAIVNSQALKDLKTRSLPNGSRLLMAVGEAPRDYVTINHPQLRGMAVHPDIAPSVRMLMDQRELPGILRALESLNIVSKRMKVSFSLFHNTALLQAYAGAGGDMSKLPGIMRGTDSMLQELRAGKIGPEIDLALKGGLKFAVPRSGVVGDVDLGRFNDVMKSTQAYLDRAIPGLGKPVAGFEAVNHALDKFTWERMHAGMKLYTFMDKFQELKDANTRDVNAGKAKPLSDVQLAKISAEFTNRTFGGINWRMTAEAAITRFGRDLGLEMYSPTGQRVLRLAFFAPDWLYSTVKSTTGVFGKGTVKGSIPPRVARALGMKDVGARSLADLHRQYQLRSAMYYVILADGIQYSRTGKHIWENKDWTKTELGDGRYMRLSKHLTDPYELAEEPGKIMGKLGAPAQVIMGEAKSVDKGEGLTVKPLMEQYIPFSMGKSGASISSTLGVPIYGKTRAEREREKELRAEKRSSAAEERRREKLREEKERGQ